MNTLDYFLKANLYGLLFAGCYWLLLRRHTFFGLNRAYLLASALLSLVLPLVSLPAQTVETLPVPISIVSLPAAAVAITPVESAPVAAQPNWEQIGLSAYGLIALFFVIRFSVRVGRLLRLIRQSHQRAHEDYVLVQPTDPTIPTFSFFRYVLLNPADIHNDLIIQHELVHVRQYHSADVVSMNLLRALFWACPALGLIDHLLRQVHEFLADKPVSQLTKYAQFLVDYSFGAQTCLNESVPLTNSFVNPSLLKQRILMLHRKATNRWALGKYALVLPLAFGLLAMTTAREEITAIVSQINNETITVSGRVTSAVDGKPLPGANVVVANTGKGASTDVQGRYKLQNVPKKALLSVSFVGFTTQVIPVNGRTIIYAALALTESNELPTMGATSMYKAIRPNPSMPVRTPPSSEIIKGELYTAVEEPAIFPTGIPGLMQYVASTLRYPAKARTAGIQGNVLVEFVVLPTGAIGSAKIKKGLDRDCDEEALRIVRQMPRWIPAKQNGKAVTSQFVLPIQFTLEKKEDKRTGQLDLERFHPTDSPIGEFPTVRDANYPNQPRLTMIIEPANSFKADTTPRSDSEKKTSEIIDNSRNGRFALYNDLSPSPIFLSDSLRSSETTSRILASRLNTGEPLYLIDGIEASKATVNRLDPKNIESINVLKHGAAIYGPKATHGAVIINTKKK